MKTPLWVLGAVMLLLAFPGRADNRKITDENLVLAVEGELLTDHGVASHLVDVEADQGIITLKGSVDNLLAKERAVKVARAVKGVRSVVDQIEIKPVMRDDQEIQKAVKNALLFDPAAESYEVEARVKNGKVTLTGKVDSWQERKLAGQVAKSVTGVRDLENNIDVTYKKKRPDGEIRAEIERRLFWDVWVDAMLVDVKVKNGRVTLSGSVGSAAEKDRAYGDSWVNGVKSVNHDDLKVAWWLKDKQRREKKYVQKTDREIKEAVKDAFLFDPRVFSFNPEVEVEYGVVTLTGTVTNLQAKKAAERDALNTVGVWRVRNYLKVRPVKYVPDDKLEEKVRNAILWDPYLERHEITVSAYNAKVYLYGTVDSRFERERATEVASRVKGVVDIKNNLSVRPTWPVLISSDWAIQQDIQDELWWSPFVDADQVSVTVRDGVATLTGTVDSYTERGAAVENAYEGGANTVRNYLKVENGYH